MSSPEIFTDKKNEYSVTALRLPERARSQETRELLARGNYDARRIVEENHEILSLLSEVPFRVIGQKLVKGEPLLFEEAFLGMTYVVSSTNKALFSELKPRFQKAHGLLEVEQGQLLGPAQTFLTSMAQREAHGVLAAEEVAGMVAAAMMDLNLRIRLHPYVLETSGMGGDRGFVVNGEKKKVINASTLSAIVLSALNIPVIKHGSYANTSAIGSTEAIEALGVNIYQESLDEIRDLLDLTNFYFSDAHIAKTIHDLSHSPFMRHETINHIIGPMTPPVDRRTPLHKIIGVNEGVHPGLIAQAYEIIHDKGYQNVGNVLVISGLSQDFSGNVDTLDPSAMKPYMMLDEVSPYSTLVGVVQNGKYIGCFVVSPESFGVTINPGDIQIVNTQEELLTANGQALKGLTGTNSDYLAMNAAAGLFTAEYLGRSDAIVGSQLNTKYLGECFERCRNAILSGQAVGQLEKIVSVSTGVKDRQGDLSFFDDVDVVILDVDNTLVRPLDPDFYRQYSEAVNRAVAVYLGATLERGTEIANFYRENYGGGEQIFLDENLFQKFPEFGERSPDFGVLYDEMCRINPSGQFYSQSEIRSLIQRLRAVGKRVVALTDSPEGLSRRVLAEAGIDPDRDFDLYVAFVRGQSPPKMEREREVFGEIAKYFQVPLEKVLSIGDSYIDDIRPAAALGMKTCLISEKKHEGYDGYRAKDLRSVFKEDINSPNVG